MNHISLFILCTFLNGRASQNNGTKVTLASSVVKALPLAAHNANRWEQAKAASCLKKRKTLYILCSPFPPVEDVPLLFADLLRYSNRSRAPL